MKKRSVCIFGDGLRTPTHFGSGFCFYLEKHFETLG